MNDKELCHYGVKGMKWGQRRYQNPDGTLTAKGQKRISKKYKKFAIKTARDVERSKNRLFVDAYNEAANIMNNGGIEKFNARQKKMHGKNFANRPGYESDYEKTFNDILTKCTNKNLREFYSTNKNYKKAAQLVDKYKMLDWDELAITNDYEIKKLNGKRGG